MKRTLLVFVVSMILAIVAAAQDKPKSDAAKDAPKGDAKPAASSAAPAAAPTVDQLLDNYIKALGGKDSIEKSTSRSMKGTFDIEAMSMSGTIEIFTKAPNKNAAIIELPGLGKIQEVFDGDKAYSANPMEGLREKTGAELAQTKRRADFYSELNMKKQFPKMEIKGKEKVGSADAWVLEATPAEGTSEKFYFDVNTWLLLRQDSEADTPQGKMNIEVYLDDYKSVDGVKIPHTMRQVTPAMSFVMKFSEIKTNVAIDDAKFAKPAGQ